MCCTLTADVKMEIATDNNLHAVMRRLLSEFLPEFPSDDGPRAISAPVKVKAFSSAVSEGRLVDV